MTTVAILKKKLHSGGKGHFFFNFLNFYIEVVYTSL